MHFKFNIYLLDCESTVKKISISVNYIFVVTTVGQINSANLDRLTCDKLTKWSSQLWPNDLTCFRISICMFEPTVNTQKKKKSASHIHISHQPVAETAAHAQHCVMTYSTRAADNGRKLCPVNQTLQRLCKLVNSALNFSKPHFSVFSCHQFKLHVSGPTEGKFTAPRRGPLWPDSNSKLQRVTWS